MDTSTRPPSLTGRYGAVRRRSVGYWLATLPVVAELGLGGIWDITRSSPEGARPHWKVR